ncbi:MAG: TrlF family AAA-like ATPase [Syntrophobacteraceae bacterium]
MRCNNPAGSLWSKWDLHVHSPCSIVQNYGGNNEISWTGFIADLEKLPSEYKVIGLNDYLFLDGYERILKAKREQNRLTNLELILPVVELRLDRFAGSLQKDKYGKYLKSDWNRVNLHIIFDQLEPEDLRQRFLAAMAGSYELIPDASDFAEKWQPPIARDSVSKLGQAIVDAAPKDKPKTYFSLVQEGFNHLSVSLERLQSALRKQGLGGHFLLAVGNAEWEAMDWEDPSIGEKRTLINGMDLILTSAVTPEAYQVSRRKLRESQVTERLLVCSNAQALSHSKHNADRIGNCSTWIKADPTFAGLRQALTELDQRVFIGDHPPKQLLVARNRTKYADSITIGKKAGSSPRDSWFDVHLPLNHDLVAIIGNKGSGKSALADTIALTGDTGNFDGFSFLNERRFRDPRAKLAAQFSGSLHWHDGTESHRGLDENPEQPSVERVKYLPQSYLETLCNELADGGSSKFESELRKIIYTHVPKEECMGFQSLDELLRFKVTELEAERRRLNDQLSKVNAEVVAIERKLSQGYRQSLEQNLEIKKKELLALESAMPAPVENPQESDSSKEESATSTARLAELEGELAAVRDDEQAARQRKAEAIKGGAHVNRISQAIGNYQKRHEEFVQELESLFSAMGIHGEAHGIVTLEVDTAAIDELEDFFRKASDEQDALLSAEGAGSLKGRRKAAEAEIHEITNALGEQQRRFLLYKEQLAAWEQAMSELRGDRDKSGTIAWYEAEIQALDALHARRAELRTSRVQILRTLHDQLGKIVDEYRKLYKPVQTFVQSTERVEVPLPLDFDVQIAEEGFLASFLSRINPEAGGSFAGSEEGKRIVRTALQETDFRDLESVTSFVEKLDEMLHFDRRSEAASEFELSVPDQLKTGTSPEDLYDYLFGLGYLSPKYSLTYDNQEISLLSPGERGLLLLVFYLLVDKDDIPLVIDQPEENLDNQTIYKVLVTCIKMAKQRRQVIMVTHNPNLAVVCDAEQIICAACDKVKKSFTYVSGAIESPEIKARVVEILEGTEPAFVNRKQKYGY